MYKTQITYKDFDGNDITESVWFRLSRAELAHLQFTHPGGFGQYLQHIVDSKDSSEIYRVFEEIIDMSYGEKSPDGKRFVKKAPDGHRLVDDFKETEGYSEFLFTLLTNPNKAAEFVNAIIPAELAAEVSEATGAPQLKPVE